LDAEVRPFEVSIPREALEDLWGKLGRTRWPDELRGVGWDYGVPLGYVKELAGHWRDGYDWREREACLNGFPQFTTEIHGQNVHFHWSEFDRGGHFAAMEAPDLLVGDVREFFRRFR
jgi:hypothetical protein